MKSYLFDILGLSGAGLVVGGAALIHPPSAMIVAGAMLLAVGCMGARRWAS